MPTFVKAHTRGGSPVRGHMRTTQSLRNARKYSKKGGRFDRLVRVAKRVNPADRGTYERAFRSALQREMAHQNAILKKVGFKSREGMAAARRLKSIRNARVY